MAFNPVPPLKNDSDEGFEEDFDPNSDAADVRGLVIQNDTSSDQAVKVTRDASDNLEFTDPTAGTKLLKDLPTSSQHQALRQLIHFIDNGPTNGFASGAYREITPSANPFPTAVIWWVDSGKTQKIVEKLVTYTGALATQVQWKMYDTDGTTVLATVTDAISYSGVFETNRTRTIA